jgi:hypothetical protein
MHGVNAGKALTKLIAILIAKLEHSGKDVEGAVLVIPLRFASGISVTFGRIIQLTNITALRL